MPTPPSPASRAKIAADLALLDPPRPGTPWRRPVCELMDGPADPLFTATQIAAAIAVELIDRGADLDAGAAMFATLADRLRGRGRSG